MSSSSIVNAAPMTIMLGIQDNSTTAPSVQPEQIPTHLPKIYLYAQKGPTTPQLVVGAGLSQMYGADTFDLRKAYATHQTALSNIVDGKGNAQMIERMIPADAGPLATMLLSLDVLPTTIPQYERNADGSYLLNSITGLPVLVSPATSIPGFICKWVLTQSTAFGSAATTVGDQTAGSVTSTRYPIYDFQASSIGGFATNSGFRIYAPTVNSDTPVNGTLLNAISAYPFRMEAISRVNATSTPTITPMQTGDQFFDFVMLPNAIDPALDAVCSLQALFPTAYQTIGQPGYQDVYADLNTLYVYQNNLTTLLNEFYAAETATGAGLNVVGSDFTSTTGQAYMFNFLSGVSSEAIPYYSWVLNTTATNAISLTENTNLYALGGSDGTMNETLFADLVTTAVSQYNDPSSELMDTAVNVESIMYDTGFPLATKKALANFIAIRKDTFIVLSTYDVNGAAMTESDEAAIGLSLLTQVSLFPESPYYGTPVTRALILGRYGSLIGTQYSKQLPITLELASKAAAFMGASDGIWNPVYLFDKAPNSELTLFTNLNVTYTPDKQRNVDWANGLNYPIAFSRSSVFFPALKTVYTNDTSVLTNFFTVMCAGQLEKVGLQAWRQFSGNISLTPGQLIANVNQFITDSTTGKFAGLFNIVPNTTITAADADRGYSWTNSISLFAQNSKTVQTLSLQAFRMAAATTGS